MADSQGIAVILGFSVVLTDIFVVGELLFYFARRRRSWLMATLCLIAICLVLGLLWSHLGEHQAHHRHATASSLSRALIIFSPPIIRWCIALAKKHYLKNTVYFLVLSLMSVLCGLAILGNLFWGA